ncbi:hypothetical protein BL250_09190 [Erwinia sp. OLTSP20]|uniref:fimbrial biogenesis chaperone n=1 Tax=unclassified Erwinia TaxID=2622719 RepID=UPI000C19ECF1|nr:MULTISPECIES: molecular chaperone [unclassified Erwinia]PIJ50705.1 hypothetical protein BV501_06865 [Erwinia sp. OAMSP11]PIJ75375.1 hypothetical protein BK416_01665 [Erwinia sp. OLSSP12]PIJ81873.1 hypothetical protein BLD47_07215 [Erwinia sp. OLCASP19]PIJ84528.1 hypothetical protein BLD46_07305 [Erwinia sp. OLMTSP26]PIJ86875.1 hypothetical protein BLD49_07075 [Erwinia sp. OLMDSP33]
MNMNRCRSASFFARCCLAVSALCGGPVFAGTADGLTFWPMQLSYSATDNKGGVALSVINSTKKAFLLKANVSAMDPDTGRIAAGRQALPPFVTVPPLVRLAGDDRYQFRIRQLGGVLPDDRESASIISVTAIPGTQTPLRPSPGGEAKAATGTPALQLAMKMNIRLFYRPAKVAPRKDEVLARQLTFSSDGRTLVVNNPTPYFVHFSTLSIGGRALKREEYEGYIVPKGSRRFTTTAPVSGVVEWTFSGKKDVYHATPERCDNSMAASSHRPACRAAIYTSKG